MELQKILLYYGFTPIEDTAAVRLWQLTLCESLGIKGRILISRHGINGTVGGDMESLKKYVARTKKYPGFKKIDFKWSEGTGNEFPRLAVRVKDELVAFGDPSVIKVDESGVVGGGKHLKPYDVQKLVEERGDEVVFFDGRNAWEAEIGRFKNAIIAAGSEAVKLPFLPQDDRIVTSLYDRDGRLRGVMRTPFSSITISLSALYLASKPKM